MIINNKEFKPIKGFDGYYASADGEIYSSKHLGKILSQRGLKFDTDKFPYKYVAISQNGKSRNLPVHKLVALAWVPIPNWTNLATILSSYTTRGVVAHHKDSNKTNNCASNLEWKTTYENLNEEDAKKKRSAGLKGNKNAQGKHNRIERKVNRYIYILDGVEYDGIRSVAKALNCSKSKITESFRRNLGLVRIKRLTRKIKTK